MKELEDQLQHSKKEIEMYEKKVEEMEKERSEFLYSFIYKLLILEEKCTEWCSRKDSSPHTWKLMR